MFKLHIDGRVTYVRSTPERLRTAMYAYIRQQRALGRTLASIEFCWTRIHITALR